MTSEEKKGETRLNSALLTLARFPCIDDGDLEESFRVITESTAEALQIERASIWFYNDDQSAIIAMNLYAREENKHSSGLQLQSQDFPAYFRYLSEERTLSAVDARTNPSTSEFTESYLKPLDIVSMLDAPIRIGGKMIGVICSEQKYKTRNWTVKEQLFVGNIADILARAIQAKERKQALDKLREMNNNLERLVDLRTVELETQRALTAHSSKMALLGEMASAIAHEINNPLAIILGCTMRMKILDERGELTHQDKAEIIADVEQTTKRIVEIIKGLRFFARDASMDDFKNVSLRQIIDDTIPLCRHKLKLSDCELIVESQNMDCVIRCQPVSISQALLNLVSNSYDAILGCEEKWVKIDCVERASYFDVRVSDSGGGIPGELMEKIMIPFFTTKPVGKGTGLGLSIVKGIIEQHGGSLTVDVGCKHTCFVMSLPKVA